MCKITKFEKPVLLKMRHPYNINNNGDESADKEYKPYKISDDPVEIMKNKVVDTEKLLIRTKETKPEQDILSQSTDILRSFVSLFNEVLSKLKEFYLQSTILRTTQPAHIIAVAAVILVASMVYPSNSAKDSRNSTSSILLYFSALSMHIGSQFWMTFMSGISLYFSLSRHSFGDVQKVLFPLYFTCNTILSAVILIQFGRIHAGDEKWDLSFYAQIGALSLCFLLELLIRLYVAPPTLKLIEVKARIEKSVGVGQEIGCYKLGPLTSCPHYMILHKTFRQFHLCAAIGNVLCMSCSAFHLYYLASNFKSDCVL